MEDVRHGWLPDGTLIDAPKRDKFVGLSLDSPYMNINYRYIYHQHQL